MKWTKGFACHPSDLRERTLANGVGDYGHDVGAGVVYLTRYTELIAHGNRTIAAFFVPRSVSAPRDPLSWSGCPPENRSVRVLFSTTVAGGALCASLTKYRSQ